MICLLAAMVNAGRRGQKQKTRHRWRVPRKRQNRVGTQTGSYSKAPDA